MSILVVQPRPVELPRSVEVMDDKSNEYKPIEGELKFGGISLYPARRPKTDKVLVLDIDETLVHTFHQKFFGLYEHFAGDSNLYDKIYALDMCDVVEVRGCGNVTQMWGIGRPYVKEFLQFCTEHFKCLIIWSAGLPVYVQMIVTTLFLTIPMPCAVFDRRYCNQIDGRYIKDLDKLWKDEHIGRYANQLNTLIIDDRQTVPSENWISIPAFQPKAERDDMLRDDQALLQLMNWFSSSEFCESGDVSKLNRSSIFQ